MANSKSLLPGSAGMLLLQLLSEGGSIRLSDDGGAAPPL